MPDEPQSYGSQGEWVTGKTGQNVNRPKNEATYDNRRESETSAPHQGGDISEEQFADNAPAVVAAVDDDSNANKRVSSQETGAKRSSFFKDRDYSA